MSFIVFKNKLIPETQINVMEVGRLSEPLLSNKQIEDVVNFPSYLYATNNLTITLRPSGEESELSNLFWTPEGGVTPLKAWTYWKTTNEDRVFEREKYNSFGPPSYNPVKLVSVSSDRTKLEIEINERFISEIEAFFSAAGISKPQFGFIALQIPFGRSTGGRPDDYKIYLFKYTHNPVFTTPGIASSSDPEVTKNEYTSAPRTYENLFVPKLSASFNYNFYQVNENSFEFSKRQNYRGKALAEIPKYIKLSWRIAPPKVRMTDAGIVAPSTDVKESSGPSSPALDSSGAETSDRPDLTEESSSDGLFVGGIFFPSGVDVTKTAGDIMTSTTTKTSGDTSSIYDFGSSFAGGFAGGGSGGDGGGVRIAGGGSLTDDPSVSLSSETEAALGPSPVSADSETLPERTREIIEDTAEAYTAESGYIGYVIFKDRILEDGSVEPLDIIVITKRNITNWIDWKVAYGETYRYKIRSVFKYINKSDFPMFADSDAIFGRSGSAEAFDSSVLFKKAYYFDSQYSDPVVVPVIDKQRPDHPHNFKIFPNSRKKRLFLSWSQKQQNKDVIGFNVYRKALNEPRFSRINGGLLNIRHNYFVDYSVLPDEKYIYAIESVDIHSNRSTLSTQYVAGIGQYSAEFNELCEKPIEFWAEGGAEINDQPKKEIKDTIGFSSRFKVIINPFFANLEEDTTYLLKVTSLDTFQEKEIKLNFKTKVINHRARKPIKLDSKFEFFEEDEKSEVTAPKIKGGLDGLGF